MGERSAGRPQCRAGQGPARLPTNRDARSPYTRRCERFPVPAGPLGGALGPQDAADQGRPRHGVTVTPNAEDQSPPGHLGEIARALYAHLEALPASEAAPLTNHALADALGTTARRVATALRQLVAAGLVERRYQKRDSTDPGKASGRSLVVHREESAA